jgi:hypothetical protein
MFHRRPEGTAAVLASRDGVTRSVLLEVAGAVVFVLVCATALNKPLTTDESEFGAVAMGVVRTGQPVYYTGDLPERYIPIDQRWVFHSAGQPFIENGLWHSSFYTFLLALVFRVFGPENWAARLLGAVCLLLDLCLLRAIVRRVTKPPDWAWAQAVLTVLFLTNPLIVQVGLLVDFDNTVTTTACLLFLHEYIRLEIAGTAGVRRMLRLTLLLALAFWTKEVAGAYLAIAAGAHEILARRWRRLGELAAASALSVLVFGLTWWLLCRALELPARYFIDRNVRSRLLNGQGVIVETLRQRGIGAAFIRVGRTLLHSVIWVSPFYAVLAVIAVGDRLRRILRRAGPEPLDVITVFVVFIVVLTKLVRPNDFYVKYEYPAYGALTLLVALFVAPRIGAPSRKALAIAVTLMVAVSAAQVAALGDPIEYLVAMAIAKKPRLPVLAFYVPLGAGLAGVMWILMRQAGAALAAIMVCTLTVGALGAHLGLAWVQSEPYVTAPSWPNYGEPSIAPVVAHLRATLQSGYMPVCRKDIGFAVRLGEPLPAGRWLDAAVVGLAPDASSLLGDVLRPEISHIVLDRYSARPDLLPVLDRHFFRSLVVPGFVVFRRR